MLFDDEYWETIDGFPNYVISNHGRIWNAKSQSPLYPTVRNRGYTQVSLGHNGVWKSFYVHQLVYKTFANDWRPRIQIAHKDRDKRNNHIDNLYVRGEDIRFAKSQPVRPHARRVMCIETGQVFRNAYVCAEYINGDARAIYRCLRGEQHKHLGYSFRYLNTEDALVYGREHQIL